MLVTKTGLGVPHVILRSLVEGLGNIFLCADENACGDIGEPTTHHLSLEEMEHARCRFRPTHDSDVLGTHFGNGLDSIWDGSFTHTKGIDSYKDDE